MNYTLGFTPISALGDFIQSLELYFLFNSYGEMNRKNTEKRVLLVSLLGTICSIYLVVQGININMIPFIGLNTFKLVIRLKALQYF